jgi:Polyketide cyclase / dehydrase and lipid transport
MVATSPSNFDRDCFTFRSSSSEHSTDRCLNSLLNGEILLDTRSHTAWGAAVTAQLYLPIARERVWQQLTDYPRWVHYLPDITQSRVLSLGTGRSSKPVDQPANQAAAAGAIAQPNGHANEYEFKRIYQAASKTFLFLTAQVEVYLRVFETAYQQVQFRLESGNFHDFLAEAKLKDLADGTLLTYFVQATPTIPVPSVFIQQAIHLDLPTNLRQMRQALCR